MGATSPRAWVDFRALRAELDFRKVLGLYNVKFKEKPGEQVLCFCPLPTHQGKRRSPSFSINLERGIWQCFGCSAKGNVLDFAARMEGLDPLRGNNIRITALKLIEHFGLSIERGYGSATNAKTEDGVPESAPSERGPEVQARRAEEMPVIVNAPLDFSLQDLDARHPYLFKRGLTEGTIDHFGLGFCNRGMFKNRIAIPIRNVDGRLVAYAGRLTDDRAISEANPKYKLPPPRERDGKRYELHKSELVYNLHAIAAKAMDIIIVEGFPSVWWLWQHHWENAVALMGADCSEEQAKLIASKLELDGRVWVLTDGDKAGVQCAATTIQRIVPFRFVRWVRLNEGEQPTDCSPEDLTAMLTL
jgi:DNA primase